MAGGSEEYLASLGFDTSDVDKAVQQTITLLGHLGNQFDGISKKTEKAERALLQAGTTAKKSGQQAKDASQDWLKLRESIYDQADAYKRLEAAKKTAQGNISGSTGVSADEQIIAAQGRLADATDKRLAAERRLNSEKQRGFATSRQLMSEWDKEFNALSRAVDAQNKMALTSPALRYALYDISITSSLAAAGITAVGVAALTTAASFESSFTNVQRTLDESVSPAQVGRIKESLLQLSREIPKSFGDISQIATLGNQLGIASGDVDEFTATIARFSAVSGVSAEETAKVFGAMQSILGISADEFENLGSAIALVARKSAATDAEILSLTKEIGQQATAAGFAASDVVALAGALGQLRVPPERSRGALTTYFQTLNMAVAEGGDKLEAFARVIGVTTGQLETMVRSGQGTEIFQKFVGALQDLDNVDATRALDDLGLSQLRVSDTFQRLGSAAGTFNNYLAMSSQAYTEGSELARQYAMVVDDLASKWQLFLNALGEFGAAIGSTIGPAAAWLLDVITQVLLALAQFANTPWGQALTIIAASVGALAAALLGIVGAGAAGVATMVAFRFALQQIGIEAATTGAGLRGLTAAMLGLEVGATRGAIAMRIFRTALITTGVGALVAAIGFLVALLVDLHGTISSIQAPLSFIIDLATEIARAFAFAGRAIAGFGASALGWIPGVGDAMRQLAAVTDASINSTLNSINRLAHIGLQAASSLEDATSTGERFGTMVGGGAAALKAMGNAGYEGAEGLGALGDSAAAATQEVRTLVDYANDLTQVMQRAFDIRYGAQQAADSITTGWTQIKDRIADANAEIREHRATLKSLAADKAIQKYWLSVAENYGDDLRAGALRGDIAETNSKIAKTSKDLARAQSNASTELKGNSQAAIQNRAALLGLVQNYQQMAAALAASGLPADELQRRLAALKQQFYDQASQLGFNRNEVKKYAQSFDDMATAVDGVPRNITVKANVNPALQALNELEARAKSAARGINGALGSLGSGAGAAGKDAGAKFGNGFKGALDEVLAKARVRVIPGGQLRFDSNGRMIEGNVGNLRFYRSGTSWTGSGNPWEAAGIVHNREAVLNERGTQLVPSQFINAANQGRNPWQYAPRQSAPAMPSSFMVELSPIDRALIAEGQNVTVMLAAQTVATATGDYDNDDSRRGGA